MKRFTDFLNLRNFFGLLQEQKYYTLLGRELYGTYYNAYSSDFCTCLRAIQPAEIKDLIRYGCH